MSKVLHTPELGDFLLEPPSQEEVIAMREYISLWPDAAHIACIHDNAALVLMVRRLDGSPRYEPEVLPHFLKRSQAFREKILALAGDAVDEVKMQLQCNYNATTIKESKNEHPKQRTNTKRPKPGARES